MKLFYIFIFNIIFGISNSCFAGSKVIKKPVNYTDSEKQILEYNLALEKLDSNQKSLGKQKLILLVQNNPNFDLARLKLIEIYKSENNKKDLENILREGLKKNNSKYEYIINMVTLYQEKNQHKKALDLLYNTPKEYQSDYQYQSLLALSYYKEGIYDLAKKHYEFLTRQDERNSAWWLGLAVSQEAIGDIKNSIRSFKQVKTLGKLDPKVLKFIDQKIIGE